MIVQPNFLDHWKTRLLQAELGDDPLAPTYVLRLWGHCQEQKTHRFTKLSAGALAAICCFKTSPEQLWLAMQTSGFIVVKNSSVEVHEWDKYNSGLITSWENGKRGGRPKKPTGIPQVTHGQPGVNPDVTDREDKIDKIKEKLSADKTAPTSDADWLAILRNNPAYDGINIGAEYGKMQAWCGANKKLPTRRRFVNWLNRADKPMPRQITITSDARPSGEPTGWRAKLNAIRPENTFDGPWAALPESLRKELTA